MSLQVERLETEAQLNDALSQRAKINLESWERKSRAISQDDIDAALLASVAAKETYQQRRSEHWKLRQERETAVQRITEYVKQARELRAFSDRARKQAADLVAERSKLERLVRAAL